MKDVAYYQDREQTYLKHFFLERYLERVAWVLGMSRPTAFVYVDGFSGPWKSEDENFEDTSFIIAVNKLREVRKGLIERTGRAPRMRCLFIEKNPKSFVELKRATDKVTDLEVQALLGEFEELIPDILKFIGNGFSLVFIDPTGWTGFALNRIKPILEHKSGEVLVNFMFDHINRFIGDPSNEDSFRDLLGGLGWDGVTTEDGLIDLYRERLRSAGSFAHVTSTRILKPLTDRSYFYLVYGTRHIQGLREFRSVEKKSFNEQERVRIGAKQHERLGRSLTMELFAPDALLGAPSFEEERNAKQEKARNLIRSALAARGRVPYDEIVGPLLEIPLIWPTAINKIIKDMREDGELDVLGFTGKEWTCKEGEGHVLVKPVRSTASR